MVYTLAMAYATRSTRRLAKKTKRNLIATMIIIIILIYATLNWVLPTFVGGLGFINGIIKPPKPVETPVSDDVTLAPPVFNIPYEATNTAKIDIKGYATYNSRVKLYVDDELRDAVEASEDGSFIIRDVLLSLSTNNIYGKAVDDKDRESLPSKTIKLILDNEKPKIEIFEPTDGKSIQGERKMKIVGKTEPDSEVYINGSRTIVNSEGAFTLEVSLNDGENTYNIKSQDKASNYTEVVRRITFQP